MYYICGSMLCSIQLRWTERVLPYKPQSSPQSIANIFSGYLVSFGQIFSIKCCLKRCWNKQINQSNQRRSIWKIPLQREIADDAPKAIKPLRKADLKSRNGWNNNLMMWILLLLNSYFIWFRVLEAHDTCFMILLCCFFSSPVLALLIPIQRLIQIPFVRFWNSRLYKSRAAERDENTTNTPNIFFAQNAMRLCTGAVPLKCHFKREIKLFNFLFT